MTGTAYNWNTAMGGLAGLSPMGSWFNPSQPAAAALPAPVAATTMPTMPTGADLSWALPNQANPFSYGGYGAPAGVTPGLEASGGLMNMLRGQKGVSGDGITGWFGNGQNLNAAVQGISALTSAWQGYQQLKVAKDQLNFQKDAWQKNYGNSVKTYNTSLEDRIRGRTADYGGKENDVQSYIDKNKLG